MGCVLVALVAPREQLRQAQQLVWELSRCEALWGRPKVFLLLSGAPAGEWAGQGPLGGGAAKRAVGAGKRAEISWSRSPCCFSTQLPPSLVPSSLNWASSVAAVLASLCCSCWQR